MELGSNFVAKLEPFLLMAKSLRGAAAAKLIQDATSAPGVFVFTELLELPNIREVRLTYSICSIGHEWLCSTSLRKANNILLSSRYCSYSHTRLIKTIFVEYLGYVVTMTHLTEMCRQERFSTSSQYSTSNKAQALVTRYVVNGAPC